METLIHSRRRRIGRRRAIRQVLRPALTVAVRWISGRRRSSPTARFRLVSFLVGRILRFHATGPAVAGTALRSPSPIGGEGRDEGARISDQMDSQSGKFV